MNTTNTITQTKTYKKELSFHSITKLNDWIATEEKNAMGISIILLILGTMIASISAALAVHNEIALFPLIFTCISAMGANAIVISQRSFKTIIWAFIINILGNILLIAYQLIELMA